MVFSCENKFTESTNKGFTWSTKASLSKMLEEKLNHLTLLTEESAINPTMHYDMLPIVEQEAEADSPTQNFLVFHNNDNSSQDESSAWPPIRACISAPCFSIFPSFECICIKGEEDD